MALKLFEFVEKFMTAIFLLEIIQIEIAGSIGKTFILLKNLIINFHFQNSKSIAHVVRDLYIFAVR